MNKKSVVHKELAVYFDKTTRREKQNTNPK